MKTLVIFDLDGTLLDTSEGIINSYKHVIEKFNLIKYSDAELKSFIGCNLFNVFKIQFKLDNKKAQSVIWEYRNYYREYGYKQARLYDGIKSNLEGLLFEGAVLAVATLKLEFLAKLQLSYFGLSKYFEVIKAMDETESLCKSELIKACIDKVNPDCSIMVGDSENDRFGALKNNIQFVSVNSERR